MKRVLLVLALTYAFCCCATLKNSGRAGGQAAIDCAKEAVKAKVEQLVPTVVTVVSAGAANWRDQLKAFTEGFGTEATACALRGAAASLQAAVVPRGSADTPESLAAQTGITNARTYLDDQKWSFKE